ncbi:MAG TPA: hypothetical protein VF066_07415 [Thermoleophilaceae bacterium]
MKIRLLFAAVAALAVVVIGSAGTASAVQGHQTKYATITEDCINSLTQQDEGDITYTGPVEVWPPNHKYVSATITVTDDDAEPVTDGATAAVAGRHDQMVDDTTEMNGAGNTDPATDVVPGPPGSGNPATTTVQFRAERSGHKWTDGGNAWRGRTYTFTVSGTTDNGTTTCKPVDFTAVVPHDQGNHTGSSTTTASKKLSAKSKALRLRRSR